MRLTSTEDLKAWAGTAESSIQLPELICRLIRSTTTAIMDLKIPLGKGIWRGGWDGIVESSLSTEFVPEGTSLWEWGISENYEKKANKDYETRTEDTNGQDIIHACFIFVTPHVWEKKDVWIAEKKAENKWGDIKIYDGQKLEQWLQLSPVQSLWLARQIQRLPDDGFELPLDFWENWRKGPNYSLLPEILTSGRESIVASIRQRLKEKPGIIPVQASSREEALAFFISAILQLELPQQENVLSRALVVEDEKAFKVLTSNRDSLVLIIKFEPGNLLHNAVSKGHFILLPLSGDDEFRDKDKMVLPRLDREGFVNALIQIGFPEERARINSKESSRNITIFRRSEGFDYSKPEWAHPKWVGDLLPILLAGKWNDTKEGDRIILEKISGQPYTQLASQLHLLKQLPDAPIKLIGQQWRLSSPLDAWAYLSKYCSEDHFKKLEEAILTALAEEDPSLDLDIDKRYMASMYKKELTHSTWLREGLVQSLILMAVYGDQFQLSLTRPVQLWVDNVLLKLFRLTNSRLWRSVNDIAPLLAEASPEAFMSTIEKAITTQPDDILSIFEESADTLTGRSYHSGYLWALEGIAWMPKYLGRVSLLLSNLTNIDPGGRLSNRPIKSLHQIFLPWMPQTLATPAERITVLQLLSERIPSIAWNLCVSLLPKMHGVAFPAFKFRWRLFEQNLQNIQTNQQRWDSQSAILDILLKLASTDPLKLSVLINSIDKTLSLNDRNKIIQHIQKNFDHIIDKEHEIWNSLRKLLYHHRYLPGAVWAISEIELSAIEVLFYQFSPATALASKIWVFEEDWPEFPDGNNGQKYSDPDISDKISQKRATCLKEIYDEIGIEGLISIIPTIKAHHRYGEALASIIDEDTQIDRLLSLLKSDDQPEIVIMHVFIGKKHTKHGNSWVVQILDKLKKEEYEDKDVVKILTPLPPGKPTWNIVETLPESLRNMYWSKVNPWLHGLSTEEMKYAIQNLIKVKRYRTALHEASRFVSDISSSNLEEILKNALFLETEPERGLDNDDVTKLFLELDTRSDIEASAILKLEYIYTPLLLSGWNERGILRIHKELSSNPAFFVESMQIVYKSDDGNEQNDTSGLSPEEHKFKVERFHTILYHWNKLPGIISAGEIDKDFLISWINEVRDLAKKVNYTRMAEAFIGKILAQAPLREDRCPNDIICEIIELIDTDVIKRNYSAALTNLNSFTSRGVFEGGVIERGIVTDLRRNASKMALRWPVMSSIYESIAREYDARAKYEDNQAQRMDLDY